VRRCIALIATVAISASGCGRDARDLAVGDCFDQLITSAEKVQDVTRQPCNDAHDNEVMLITDYPAAKDAAFPSDADMETFVDEKCVSAYQSYTGRDPTTESEIGLDWYAPTAKAWAEGTRKVVCYLFRNDGAKMTAPLKAP
jgi:hypothetical protein